MTNAGEDALLAAQLCATDPSLGGIVLRGGGDGRDPVIAALAAGRRARRLPVHADAEALDGGLDLGATLARGAAVARAGLVAEAEMLVAPMAERMRADTAARLAAALDAGRLMVVALDDGVEQEGVPSGLAERLAFRADLTQSSPGRGGGPCEAWWRGQATSDSAVVPPLHHAASGPPPRAGEDLLAALVATAAALGVDSARASLFALRAARAAARLAGRDAIAEEDVILAARLVLAPRATRVPAEAEAEPPPPEQPDDPAEPQGDPRALEDIVLAATLAALPKDVLARIAAEGRSGRPHRGHGAGERRRSPTRGRPVGVRAGVPRGGLRLALIDTLRAAAPWQRLRGRDGPRVRVHRDDLRVRRFETRAPACTIFAVDASGSSALARLAEAKGAVELLLGAAYVKRAEVALVAFRGLAAETLLPPTRSLTRARRALADLPGGGGTPLAAGLDAALDLALKARAKGRTPFLVVLTDGRANVAREGGTAGAEADALAAARAIGSAGVAGAFVDISARPRVEGERIAAAMRARYLPLPRADAGAMHAAVTAAR